MARGFMDGERAVTGIFNDLVNLLPINISWHRENTLVAWVRDPFFLPGHSYFFYLYLDLID